LILLAVQSESLPALQARLKELPNRADLMETCFAGLREHVPMVRQKTYAAVMEMICSKALIDGSLTAEQRAEWQTRLAVAQTRAGNVEAASRNLQELASRYPDSLTIQLELARVLSQSAPHAATSMDQWRRLASRLKPGTESWFEAKYSIAQLLADNDRAAEAKRLLEYVQATQLQWKSSSWAERIESLLKKLSQAGG
jgi:predicted Zn-dependent protease